MTVATPPARLLVALAAVLIAGSCTITTRSDDAKQAGAGQGDGEEGDAEREEAERDETGVIVEPGDLDVFALEVGDCIDAGALLGVPGAEATVVGAFVALPCSESHSGEVVLFDELFFDGFDEFPGDEALFEGVVETCVDALEEYTGAPIDSTPFDVSPLVPTEGSWNEIDDRGLLCIGVTLDEGSGAPIETTGSIGATQD